MMLRVRRRASRSLVCLRKVKLAACGKVLVDRGRHVAARAVQEEARGLLAGARHLQELLHGRVAHPNIMQAGLHTEEASMYA